jgi:D-3-phosphoglycerate dehydrogenase
VVVIDHRFPDLDAERNVLAAVSAEVIDLRGADDERIMEVAATADAILLGARFKMDRGRLSALKRCRVIARYGVGVDNVDVVAAAEQGIVVTYVPDYCVEEVANHTLALLLALCRRLFDYDAAVRGMAPLTPGISLPRLSKCTLGILGFGRIGQQVARRALAFDLRVLAYDTLVPNSDMRVVGASPASFAEVVTSSDFISLHLPLDKSTHHILDAAAIESMRPGSIVINVGRGGLVDEIALGRALTAGQLSGAGIDVTEMEPLPRNHPLRSAPNVIFTPHVAWFSSGARNELQVKTAGEAVRVLSGRAPLNAVSGQMSE